MEYLLISEVGAQRFMDKINQALRDGYEPIGGATLTCQVINDISAMWYTQALIRK